MSNRKNGPGLFGLLVVAALGVAAFASSAQAANPLFYVNGVPSPAALNATFSGRLLGVTTLLIGAMNTEIKCTSLTVTTGVLVDNLIGHGTFLFEGCTVLVDSTKAEQPCEIVVNHSGDNRKHITATALLLPAELTNGEPAILVEKIAANVLMKEGTPCILLKTNLIKGEMCLKILTNHAVELEVEANNTFECRERNTLEELNGEVANNGVKDKLLFGAQAAVMFGKADLRLTGAHNNLPFGVLLD